MSDLSMYLPETCEETWDEMMEVGVCKRNCLACQTLIHDFSDFTDEELHMFFGDTQESMCGRIRE